ncbi:MAG: heavy metal sensor histidine kinase [Planctomycetes bacterium]|nr:heavy metal sensor histidine kinase [Planctomycetota bacterium]
MSFRLRLTLWNLAILATIVVLYGTFVLLRLESGLLESLDQQLAEDIERLERELDWTVDGTALVARVPREAIGAGDEDPVWVEVDDVDGNPLYRSQSLGPRRLPRVDLPRGVQRVPRKVTHPLAGGIDARVHATSDVHVNRTVVYKVARPLEPHQQQIERVRHVLWLASPVALLLALLGGYFLARKALQPIDRMRVTADHIEASNLHERIPIGEPNDELGRLGTTLNRMIERLERSFLMLRQFTADASHELRTPLSAMRVEIEVCLREARDAEGYRETLESALEEIARLTQLVDQLLMLSRADADQHKLERRLLDFPELARSVVHDLEALAEERRQVLSIDTVEYGRVSADPVFLKQAIVNLVHNAIRYANEGGRIEVAVERRGKDLLLRVDDDGPGVSVEHRARIFDRFYRVDKSRSRELGGTGLGLAITKWAIESMEGHLAVEDSHLGGARFLLWLPAVVTGSRS